MPRAKTSDQIIAIARDILTTDGLAAVSFDAIAHELGRSKQAVLYWFPTKQILLAAMFLPWLEEEAVVASLSVNAEMGRDTAISSFIRAVANFHFEDFDRFRMMYLVPQTIRKTAQDMINTKVAEQVHPVTDRIYSALAACLDGDEIAARQEAVAIHSAVLGLALLFALADGLNDPLKHLKTDLVNALIASMTTA